MKRLLYLGMAFPPGVAGHFPELQPAGHVIETAMIDAVRPWFEVKSVGISELQLDRLNLPPDGSVGLPHELNLLDRPPEIFHRLASLARLKQAYRAWVRAGWRPDVIVVCNFVPVYSAFTRWLRRQRDVPPLVLYLADSMGLGQKVPWLKRFRYRFKPLAYPDDEMAGYYDACVSTSRTTGQFITPRGLPWLWLPNGCDARRALRPGPGDGEGPVSFGFFGSLSPHTGLPALLKIFLARNGRNPLRVCGFGKIRHELEASCRGRSEISFCGPMKPDECLRFAQDCDVMVNPRPLCPGNDNNFSSKVFEYALTGRAILTSRVSGVDEILGADAFYFDENDFEHSLTGALGAVAGAPRAELRRRGAALQQRMLEEFSWARQGRRLAEFLEEAIRRGQELRQSAAAKN